MRRIVSASLAVLFLGLTPLAGFAASILPKPMIAANPSVILAQGWWEHEHREQRARQGYWRLPPPELDQYHRLQQEINQLRQERRESMNESAGRNMNNTGCLDSKRGSGDTGYRHGPPYQRIELRSSRRS